MHVEAERTDRALLPEVVIMAREELGLDPDELDSPWSAALSSLVAFALGAVVVVLPYMFESGLDALVAAIALGGLALFGVGATIGRLNGRGGLRSGTRQLLVGGAAALLVFLIGTWRALLPGYGSAPDSRYPIVMQASG